MKHFTLWQLKLMGSRIKLLKLWYTICTVELKYVFKTHKKKGFLFELVLSLFSQYEKKKGFDSSKTSQHDYEEQIDDMMLFFDFCVLQQKNDVKSM